MTPLIYIDREEGLQSPDDDSFSCWINAALAGAGTTRTGSPEISVRINTSDEMAQLNADFRGKQGPTNVLSFPAELPEGIDCQLLGDIAICASVVEREAAEQDKSIDSHWAHMTVHGVLHLLGFDHIDDAEAEVMEQLEIAILEQLGYPDPYRTSEHLSNTERACIP